MKFSKQVPIKVVMLGVGGTGGYIATHLYRLLHALERKVRFIICDGDTVERKNLVRQNFTEADLGLNKARVLAERYADVFGMACEYIPSFIETEDRLMELLAAREVSRRWTRRSSKAIVDYELVILLGAVDNDRSRQMCHRVFQKSNNLIYIDSGNGVQIGQVVCGVRKNGHTISKPVASVAPDVLRAADKFPSELSCAEAAQSAPQSIMANVMAATSVLCMLYNILTEGENIVRRLSFSTRTCMIRPVLEKVQTKSAA